jgi:allophanate hydrolase subunit 2
VLLGPQEDYISAKGRETFLSGLYQVTQRTDRMGCVLEGPPIEHQDGPDIISDGTAFGSIQVPGSGQPLVLMADRQTTGGYVKIATVLSFDLPLLAQALPGWEVRFKAVTLEAARAVYYENEGAIARFREES